MATGWDDVVAGVASAAASAVESAARVAGQIASTLTQFGEAIKSGAMEVAEAVPTGGTDWQSASASAGTEWYPAGEGVEYGIGDEVNVENGNSYYQVTRIDFDALESPAAEERAGAAGADQAPPDAPTPAGRAEASSETGRATSNVERATDQEAQTSLEPADRAAATRGDRPSGPTAGERADVAEPGGLTRDEVINGLTVAGAVAGAVPVVGDWVSAGTSLTILAIDPSLSNLGGAALDLLGALPGVPALGTLMRLEKIGEKASTGTDVLKGARSAPPTPAAARPSGKGKGRSKGDRSEEPESKKSGRDSAAARRFLNDTLNRVKDPQHPLHFLVKQKTGPGGSPSRVARGPKRGDPKFEWNRTERTTKAGKTQTGRFEGAEDGPVVQIGHQTANSSGATERFMLEDADLNQLGGQTIESARGFSQKWAYDIAGVPVDVATARQWANLGLLDPRVLDTAPLIPPPPF